MILVQYAESICTICPVSNQSFHTIVQGQADLQIPDLYVKSGSQPFFSFTTIFLLTKGQNTADQK